MQSDDPLKNKQTKSNRRGWLCNGALSRLRHDMARTGTGSNCNGPALKDGRCRMHGGRRETR